MPYRSAAGGGRLCSCSNPRHLASENCDTLQNTVIQRGNLCGMYKFPRRFTYGINNVKT